MSSSGASAWARLAALLLGAALLPSCGGNGPSSTSTATPASVARPSVSQNGRIVAFESGGQVVVVDRVNQTSAVINGNDVANADVTPDGRLVAFDAIPSDGGPRQVFLRDQSTGEVTLISATPDGVEGNGDSTNPSVSDNGAIVAFQSEATNLGATSSTSNSVLVRDVGAATIRSASSSDTGDDVNPAVSGDGNFVAFESRPLGGSGFSTVLLWNSGNSQVSPVSTPPGSASPDGPSGSPSIDGDGRFVAFESRATNLVANASPPLVFAGESNIFVRDMVTNLIVDASVPLAPSTAANGDSHNASLSEDGTQVTFDSTATNLTADVVTAGESNVFLRDLTTETTTLVTQPAAEPTPVTPPTPPVLVITPPVPRTGSPVVPTNPGVTTGTTPVVPTGAGTLTSTGTAVTPAGTEVPTATGTTTPITPVAPVPTDTQVGTTPVVPPGNGTAGITFGGALVGPVTPTTNPSGVTAPPAPGVQVGTTPVVPSGNGTAGFPFGGVPVTTTSVTTVAAIPVGSVRPKISPDGAWVVFESRGQNLAGVSAASGTRIFIADLRSRTLAEIR
jgi:Tol biopolymer transport system component